MRIIKSTGLVPSPWKNGGGITREIASHSINGNMRWRLSIADVDQGGPFSSFPGLSRILTVIEGPGMSLHASGETLHALPLQPLAFSGDLGIEGGLDDGRVRNFNVIFDPRHVNPSVVVHTGPQDITLPKTEHAVYCLTGTAGLSEIALSPGDTALIDSRDIHLDDQTQIICVTL